MKAYHYVNNYGELHRLTPQRYAKYLRDVADGGDVTDALDRYGVFLGRVETHNELTPADAAELGNVDLRKGVTPC